MLGSRWDHTILSRWIDEQRDLEWVLANLRLAQYDVEFGRADLNNVVESDLEVVVRPRRDDAAAAAAAKAAAAGAGSNDSNAGAGR